MVQTASNIVMIWGRGDRSALRARETQRSNFMLVDNLTHNTERYLLSNLHHVWLVSGLDDLIMQLP